MGIVSPKSRAITNCKLCGAETPAFDSGGHPRNFCSVSCRCKNNSRSASLNRVREDPVDYLMARIAIVGECWEWQRSTNGHGYGQFQQRGVRHKAHRFSYELFVGPIPPGLHIDHLCRNRACVNPEHLEAVSCGLNISRGESPTAKIVRSGACKYGHPRTEDNLKVRVTKNGRVTYQCRECLRARKRVGWKREKRPD